MTERLKESGRPRAAIRVAMVSRTDARLVGSYSGIPYNLVECLKQAGMEVELVSPFAFRPGFLLKAKHWIYRKILGKTFLRDRDESALRQYASEVSSRVDRAKPDIIVSVNTLPFRYCAPPPGVPLVIWAEASFRSVVDFYPMLSNLAGESRRSAEETESIALVRADAVILPSKWAAQDVIDHYGIAPHKVHVVPYGAIAGKVGDEELERLTALRLTEPVRFLYLGNDWSRKGGNEAVVLVRALNALGVPAELDIVGTRWIDPSLGALEDYIRNHGYVSKASAEGAAKIDDLYRRATFFIMLSHAETFGIVYAEAAGYGLPSIASDVGGVRDALDAGRTALLFREFESIDAICGAVVELLQEPDRYARMCRDALDLHRRNYSWEVVGERAANIVKALVPGRSGVSVVDEGAGVATAGGNSQ